MTADDHLWFMPGPDPEEDDHPWALPLPQASRRTLFDLAEWPAAEAALVQPLAELALGRLVERAEAVGPHAGARLA